jgi:hypothetical protein
VTYKEKIYKNVREYCSSNYQYIDSKEFQLGDNPFNRRCHLNSVQKIKEGKAKEVYLCVAWDKDDKIPCVHFINKLDNDKWQDNTWGWLYERNIYYIIKKISEQEYEYIWDILNDTKKSLTKLNSNRFMRWLLYNKRNDII